MTLYCTQVWAVSQCSTNAGSGWAIPDYVRAGGGTPGTVSASAVLNFGDAAGAVINARVYVDITHPFIGDLDAAISSPDSVAVELFNRPGVPASANGCAQPDILATIFDDAALSATNIEAVCNTGSPAVTGTYQPHDITLNPLSDFNAGTANGSWTLTATDSALNNSGTIDQFCVDLNVASITFDKWVSTTATCSDKLDNLNVTSGNNVYYCYTVTNTGSEQFVINPGDATDDQGVDISGLERTYAAGDSFTVTSGAITAGSAQLPVGVTTNIASVTATGDTTDFPASQTLTTTETATVSVTAVSAAPVGKLLYLDTTNLSRIVPAAGLASVSLKGGTSNSWVLTPALQSTLIVDSSSGVVPVTLVLGASGPGSMRDFSLNLISSDASVGTFASLVQTGIAMPATATYNLVLASASDITLPVGSTITLQVANTSAAANNFLSVAPNNSYVDLPVTTVINVDSIQYYNATYAGGVALQAMPPGYPLYIRATISDPFGSFDITSALITITDPAANIVVNAIDMGAPVYDSGVATKIFEYAYTIPNVAASLGTWNVSVTGNEGSEGTVSHTNTSTFVGALPPSLTVVKSSDVTTAAPGGVITYTLQITNTGASVATNVVITDDISAFSQFNLNAGTPFTFVDGASSSGLTLGAPVYSNDNAATWIYTPVSGGGGAPAGYDGNVTDFQIPMSGAMNVNGSFSLQYQLKVK